MESCLKLSENDYLSDIVLKAAYTWTLSIKLAKYNFLKFGSDSFRMNCGKF